MQEKHLFAYILKSQIIIHESFILSKLLENKLTLFSGNENTYL